MYRPIYLSIGVGDVFLLLFQITMVFRMVCNITAIGQADMLLNLVGKLSSVGMNKSNNSGTLSTSICRPLNHHLTRYDKWRAFH